MDDSKHLDTGVPSVTGMGKDGRKKDVDDGHGIRHLFTTAATAAMSIILAATVIGSAAVWRNQAIIQATRFTNTDGAMLIQAQTEMRLYMATFQTEVLRIISDLPSDNWEQRILDLERRLQDLQLEVARINRGAGL